MPKEKSMRVVLPALVILILLAAFGVACLAGYFYFAIGYVLGQYYIGLVVVAPLLLVGCLSLRIVWLMHRHRICFSSKEKIR